MWDWNIFPFPEQQGRFPAGKPSESVWQPRSGPDLWASAIFWTSPVSDCISGIMTSCLHTLKNLRDLGNTLIVVEHDEDTMRAADYIVDIGPGAGAHGGEVVACGTAEEIMKVPESVTGKYLSGEWKIPVPKERRKPTGYIKVLGAQENNLKNIDVEYSAGRDDLCDRCFRFRKKLSGQRNFV